jgi:hypothetical protein
LAPGGLVAPKSSFVDLDMRTSVADRSDCLVQVPADELASTFIGADETGEIE